MKKFTNKLEYKVIDTVQGLEEVIDLLEEGYKWGNQQSKILLSEIPKINHDYGMFGVAIYEDDSPKGAQLFIYQGSISVAGKNVNVVNISSWYVEEDYRGLPAIRLQQFTVEVLQDCIIKSYTTNWVGIEIFHKLKFRKMNLKRASISNQVHTITSDNGKEFGNHEKIAAGLKYDFYFAQPYSSWERGTNENTNGLIRQYFSKNRDFRTITDNEIIHAMKRLNNRPRKRLGDKTPNEVFFGES